VTADWLPLPRDELFAVLDRTERLLDPANPEVGGHVQVLGYGEISAVLTTDDLPGLVCKRMAGYPTSASLSAYMGLIEDYLTELPHAGVAVAPTEAIPVARPGRPPVLYLVQPRAEADSLGHSVLLTGDDETLVAALRAVLDSVAGLARRNAERSDGIEVAVDGQLSNWTFSAGPSGPEPTLIDVGTPFIRVHGRHRLDVDVVVAPAPPGIRALLRRFVADSYQDDYFVPRTLAVDLLGNFHKEGAPHRIGLGAQVVNEWLAEADLPGPRDPISVAEVATYYRRDAQLLGLFLHARRADRAIRTRLLRQPYDFLLPGRVDR
jgi:hypothetical protein